jgi:NADH:ubiquinone oxidoreductase subunit 4 (subunit M)
MSAGARLGCQDGGTRMLEKLRKVLEFQLTIGQLMAIGLIVGTPYLLIGTIWSTTHTEHLHQMHGVDLAVSFLGSIVSWPVLLFANVCMT